MTRIIANGKPVEAQLPCSIEEFLIAQNLLPRSVVVEHNGEAVPPSGVSQGQLRAGDRLEILKIVVGRVVLIFFIYCFFIATGRMLFLVFFFSFLKQNSKNFF